MHELACHAAPAAATAGVGSTRVGTGRAATGKGASRDGATAGRYDDAAGGRDHAARVGAGGWGWYVGCVDHHAAVDVARELEPVAARNFEFEVFAAIPVFESKRIGARNEIPAEDALFGKVVVLAKVVVNGQPYARFNVGDASVDLTSLSGSV